jgi:hypothetical protein
MTVDDIVATPNGTTSTVDGSSVTTVSLLGMEEAVTRPLADHAPGRPAADNPVVRLGIGTEVVVLAPDDHGLVAVLHDGTIHTYPGTMPTAPIVDPQRRLRLLSQAVTAANAARLDAAAALQQARDRYDQTMADIRGYVIDKYRNQVINRDVLDNALDRFGFDPYESRFRVTFTITGSYTTTADHAATARHAAETRLAPNLDGIDRITDDSADYAVRVDEVERCDP